MNNVLLGQTTGSLDSNNFAMVASTLIVSYLMQRFNFGTMYYGMIHGLTLQVILYFLAQKFEMFDSHYIKYGASFLILPLIIFFSLYCCLLFFIIISVFVQFV